MQSEDTSLYTPARNRICWHHFKKTFSAVHHLWGNQKVSPDRFSPKKEGKENKGEISGPLQSSPLSPLLISSDGERRSRMARKVLTITIIKKETPNVDRGMHKVSPGLFPAQEKSPEEEEEDSPVATLSRAPCRWWSTRGPGGGGGGGVCSENNFVPGPGSPPPSALATCRRSRRCCCCCCCRRETDLRRFISQDGEGSRTRRKSARMNTRIPKGRKKTT